MHERPTSYKLPIFLAVLLHLILLFYVLFQLRLTPHVNLSAPTMMQAVMISNKIEQSASVNPVENDIPKKMAEVKPVEKQQVVKKTEKVIVKKEVEPKLKLAENDKAEMKLEEQAEKKEKEKEKALAEEKAKLEAAKEKAKKIKAEKDAAEEKAKKLEAEKAQAKLKAQEEAEKKAKALADKQKHERESMLDDQLAEEGENLVNARSQYLSNATDKYTPAILNAIAQHWLIPDNVDKKASAEVMIRLAPGGSVLNVRLVKSSGDQNLDRSAVTAVYKASPLPVPAEKDLFEHFREIDLTLRPETVVGTG
ncbi:MAG: cell envelope integrity protein TolA [Gammaproteobacteria bacterium]